MRRRDVTKGLLGSAGVLIATPVLAEGLVTPKQVEGPFYPVEGAADEDLDLTRRKAGDALALGTAIRVVGQVRGIDGAPLADTLVDVWQANAAGRYRHPGDRNDQPLDVNFDGWGMMKTNEEGRYSFRTIKPGPYDLKHFGVSGTRCRHIHFKVAHAGFRPLTTQMYFEGDPLINDDQEIAKAPAERRHLLIAPGRWDEAANLMEYQFDIVLAAA